MKINHWQGENKNGNGGKLMKKSQKRSLKREDRTVDPGVSATLDLCIRPKA